MTPVHVQLLSVVSQKRCHDRDLSYLLRWCARRVQGELRVSKENLRRMDDRMRGILRERTEMASQIKAMSPAKAK